MTERNPNGGRRRLYWWSGGFVALLLALSMAIAAVPGSVAAFGRHHGGPGGHGFLEWRLERMLDDVGASDEQRATIQEIFESRREALSDLRPDRRALHERAVELLTADPIDRDALEALRAEHVERMSEASRVLAASLADAAEVLSKEQRVELAGLLEEHRGRHPHRRHSR